MREFICRVDAKDRITFVDASWVSFAAENGFPSLTLESVKGRLLWDYISDATSRHFYQVLAKKVREPVRRWRCRSATTGRCAGGS